MTSPITTSPTLFPAVSRLLHWLMAAMILAMLFIGIGMVTSPDWYHWLLSVHRPLGAAILVLAALRLLNRQLNPPPPLPRDMPFPLRVMAHLSHIVLYGLMLGVPLAGWGALSAGGYPIVLYGSIHLPPILPHSAALYTALHLAHEILALLLFATFLAHLGAALAHALVFRDGVFGSMASLKAAAPPDPASGVGGD
ncbi:cytochrome b [Azospirillum canadense]|uniref:cytochrome b n=1 Tax=Azospirillum canadense TaxID=403962 RepID=UPI002226D97C|nr:cytochrome b/b6 domain-containing protein [Azospirillum canadense]MCW2238835.1 cytochrome b561 [Azospirillum canadense]